jgi:hypothetical protein
MSPGNVLFLVGAALEVVGVGYGVNTWAVAASMIGYGIALLIYGYLE